MAQNTQEMSAAILLKLDDEIKRRLSGKRAEQVAAFAKIYYSTVAAEDLLRWRLDDLYGATLSSWEYLQKLLPGQPKVRVFNPGFEAHGWQSAHTVVQVLSDDLPFILDSLRVELNHRNLGIHAVHNAVFSLKRDTQHLFAGFLSARSRAKAVRHETLVSVEVDRHTDPAHLQDLEQALYDVFYQVAMVVDDFQPMLAQVDQLLAMYESISVSQHPQGLAEAREFLRWLKEHFTFLGYDEYQLTSRRSKQLQSVMGSQLGLLKYCDDYCRAELINDEQRAMGQFSLIPELLSFTKSPSKSRVHRPAYPDYITLKRFDEKGNEVGESRFLGLYTSEVYLGKARQIPVVRKKVDAVLARSERHEFSHDWKELLQILEVHPRDELFQASIDELCQTAFGILHIHERRQIRLFLRRDPFGQYISCLIYAPRDIYSTEFRLKVEKILLQDLDCSRAEFNTYFSESILARTHFVLRSDHGVPEMIDVESLQHKIRDAAKTWSDEFYETLVEALGEEQGIALFNHYGRSFSTSYRDDFPARTAVVDVQYMQGLSDAEPLALSFYLPLEQQQAGFSFKLFHLGAPLPLSDVLPMLENLGLRVIDEHPYAVTLEKTSIWIHDFELASAETAGVDLHQMKQIFQDAFMAIWRGLASNDQLNRLVLGAGLDWRQVRVLRAYAAYMKQLRFPISGSAISATLNSHCLLARLLVEFFQTRFMPGKGLDKHRHTQQQKLEQKIKLALESVVSLNDDKVIRQYLALIKATVRTNYYQSTNGGGTKEYLALKLKPAQIVDVLAPQPLFEVFVFSTRVQGTHLRIGKVARGGLRWSDREEDFRTELLGLLKGQHIKNAIIVPEGAQGGFVAKRLTPGMGASARQAEGEACFRDFICALLDVTDDRVAGLVVPPAQLVRYDKDDPYLVVAGDQGTAGFIDIANQIAAEYGFWLGDAFASGGREGYAQKAMGITARGAWIAIERHFRELSINIATTDFSVVGIGDMSGDVFGNAMLLTPHIRLLAAFNHQHIFIDPEPDAALSCQERQRLFALPQSSWGDYDRKRISRGGGVFSRTAKSITISREMQRSLDISAERLTPNELISQLLCAPVDLLWNAGIGTFIKAASESHAQVGDKLNDSLRVDARDLRCRVLGEGGNQGITQQARVEYALGLGRINTDFIDNAAGVDCADHEVNIKILLNDVVAADDLTAKQRVELLAQMKDEVAQLVLSNNYRQAQLISLEQARAVEVMHENRRFIVTLEKQGRLDRTLACIPADEVLIERQHAGIGLTRPELAILVACSKAELKEKLIKSTVPDDPFLAREIGCAFPKQLAKHYKEALQNHCLRREIVATQLANNVVNLMGFKFVNHLQSYTRSGIDHIIRAYVLARDVFDIRALWLQIEALDYKVDAVIQMRMMDELQYLMRRATRWFVLYRPVDAPVHPHEVKRFRQAVTAIAPRLGELLCGQPRKDWHEAYQRYTDARVPAELASVIAGVRSLHTTLGIVEISTDLAVPVEHVARALFEVGEYLHLDWLMQCLNDLERESYWQALARESFRDDLARQLRRIITALLSNTQRTPDEPLQLEAWRAQYPVAIARWMRMISDLKGADKRDYALFTVAISELVELAKACSEPG